MKRISLLLILLLGLSAQGQTPRDSTPNDNALVRNMTGGLIGGKRGNLVPVNPAPRAPQNLAATAVNGQINLDWDDLVDPDLQGYVVYRSTDGVTYYPHTTGFAALTDDGLDYRYMTDNLLSDADSQFDDDPGGWTLNNGTTISGGVAVLTSADATGGIQQTVGATIGKTYLVTYDIVSYTEGGIYIAWPGLGTTRTTTGTFSEVITATDSRVRIRASANPTTATLDNVSVREVAVATTPSNTPLTSSQYQDTAITDGQVYYYRILAVDSSSKKSGFSSVASETGEDTTAGADATAPSTPIILTSSPGLTDVSLTWGAAAATDLDYYSIHRDTTSPVTTADQIATSTGPQYSDSGLTEGTTYYYAISATDITGNESSLSDEVTVTTNTSATATAYTHYKFEATGLNSGTTQNYRWEIEELQGYESNDHTGTNVFDANFLAATASSGTGQDHQAFDGNAGTYWDSFNFSGNPTWIAVEMDTAFAIKSIRDRPFNPAGEVWTPSTIDISGSNDGSTWTLLQEDVAMSQDYTDKDITDVQVDAGPTAEGTEYFYYKFEAASQNTDTPASYRWEIEEIEGFEANTNTGTNVFNVNFDTALAGSGLNEDHRAFDADANTYWDSFNQAGVTWIYVKLDTAKVVRSATIRPFIPTGSAEWIPQTINIYGSNNGTDWTLLKGAVALSQDANDKDITDIQAAGAGGGPGTGDQDGGAGTPGTGNYDITIDEIGYQHIAMSWPDDVGDWDDPYIIQRTTDGVFTDPTDLTNNQAADNTGAGTFRFVGLNATEYIDIEDLAEGTTYYYRIAPVTNLKAHYDSATTPTFGTWKYGAATTGTLASAKKVTYDVTQSPYSADNTGATNAYTGVKAAWDAAIAAGGGIVYFPAGTYKIYPTDADISDVGGIPTADPGDSYSTSLFPVTSDNMVFRGAGSGSVTLNLRLWNDNPATEWLQIRNASSQVTNIRRYFMFLTQDVSDFTLEGMTINAGATPVDTGKEWYSLDHKRYQWDISHKLVASFDTNRIKNIIVDDIITSDWRGEVFYTGGVGHGKYFMKDTTISRTNSSAISMSAAGEYVNVTINEASNACFESVAFANVTDYKTGRVFGQNTIARGVTMNSFPDGSTMAGLPGEKKAFWGWQVFNQAGTYQTLTDVTFTDTGGGAYNPWSETRDALMFNYTVTGSHKTPGYNSFIDWRPGPKALYNLSGGLSNNLILGGTYNVEESFNSVSPIIINYSAGLEETNRVISSLDFVNGSGANRTIDVFLLDRNAHGDRTGFLFEDITTSGAHTTTVNDLYNGSSVQPTYSNVFP